MSTKTIVPGEPGVARISLAKLSPAARELAAIAAYLDWRLAQTRTGGVNCVSPDGSVHFTIPGGANVNENRLKGWYSKLFRYGDQLRVAALRSHTDEWERHARAGTLLQHIQKQMNDNPRLVQIATGMEFPGLGDELISYGPPEPEPKPESTADPCPPTPVIVNQRPWLARHSSGETGGRVYPSRTVIERKWSDGALDYKCALEGCEYTDPVPQTVASHYRASNDHPMVEPPTAEELMRTEPWVPRKSSPADRMQRLARELAWALEQVGGTDGPAVADGLLAEQLAEVIVRERDRKRQTEEEERGPLTADQVIERIRRLVDDGSYYRAVTRERELEDQVLAAQVEAQECRDAAETALARTRQVEQDWNALLELLSAKAYGTETGS